MSFRRLFFFFFSFSSALLGQAITGTVVGTIEDPTGAVLPNAAVTLTNQNTNVVMKQTTNDAGDYTFTNVPVGNYRNEASLKGFGTVVANNVVVQVNQITRVDLTLSPGAVTEQVTVNAAAPLVQSTTSEIGEVIDSRQIVELPLNGRLFEQLVILSPGAVQASWGDFSENPAASGARAPANATVNGLPWSGNNYLIDGVANNEPLNQFINISPPVEAIEEFKLQTNTPSAESGVFGGAIVNLTMKSGTNEFHGSLFEFLRNDKLNARDFFAAKRSPFKTNQFGGTLGGPVVRNKLFFFLDYQGLRERQGRNFLLTVPTTLQRQGILTEGANPPTVYDPLNKLPFNGNVIPASRFNPISQKALSLWPQPNLTGLTNNFATANSLSSDVDAFDVKVDLNLTAKDRFLARESLSQRNFVDPPPAQFLSSGETSDSRNQNAVAGETHIFGSNRINEFRVGFNRFALTQIGADFGIDENNLLGIPNGNIPGLAYTSGVAQFNIPGFQNTGSQGYVNSQRIATTYQYTDNFSIIMGRHSIRFGGDVRRVHSTLTNPQTQPRGLFTFDGNYTSNQGASGTGNAFGSFLLGYPTSTQRDFVNTRPDVHINYIGFFAQDDYRVSSRLTLNLGLRYDIITPPVEKYNRQSNFNPGDGLIHVANGNNRGPDVDTFYHGFGPRVGLAYSPDGGKTAFRAGYGISYFADNFGANGGTLERDYPFFQINNIQAPNQFTPTLSLSQGLPADIPVQLAPTLAPPPGFGVFYVTRNFQPDVAQMWSASVQRQIGQQSYVDLAFVRTKGTHLYRDRNINVPLPGPGDVGPRRPYYSVAPAITSIDQRASDGDSSYNSLQAKFEKRFSAGFQTLVSYTWSRTIDDVSNIIYPYFDKLNRGPSSGFKQVDVPQNFVASFTYELPFGPGKRFASGSSGVVRKLVEGWSVNSITSLYSGQPLVLTVSSSLLNTTTGNVANINCTHVSLPKNVGRWFDTGCFSAPPPYTFGNSGIGHVRGPGVANVDFSLFKNVTFMEGRSLELRGEFFNLMNTAHFSNPNTTFGTSNFGQISSDRLPPREIQVAARFRF